MLVRLRNISKTFPRSKIRALDKVSLELCEGEILSIVGENGSGKSTLLRVIAGLVIPDEGEIYRKFNPKAVRNMMVHFEEINNLFKRSTPYEMIEYFAILNGIKRNKMLKASIESLLEEFDLRNPNIRYVTDLSRGMKQKLSLCFSLIIRPKILLLDEPTLGLDADSIDLLTIKLKELSNNNIGVLIATHDKEFIEKVSTKSLYMKKD